MNTLILLGLWGSFFIFLIATAAFLAKHFRYKKWLRQIFFEKYDAILKAQSRSVSFETKLHRAGISKKEYKQIVLVAVLAGISLASLSILLHTTPATKILFVLLGIGVAVFTPTIYLQEQTKARIKRIENDLAIFIDLLIIILEGGGGLHNAIDQVTEEAQNVIGKDLIEESKRFKYEFITYDSEIAYNNLINRTGSEAIATIVGFMKLSQETGIGVKSIFENQSNEIKENEMLELEKKSSTMNIAITFTMFLFILPAIIAMIAFPIASGAIVNINY